MSFRLLDFQEEAVVQMHEAIAMWAKAIGDLQRPPTTVDGNPIPLLGQLFAITGGGKTPILAKIIGGVGPAVVLWTTNRSVVVDQTVEKLKTTYRHFLPIESSIFGENPTPAEWADLVSNPTALSIWCLTVASWNDTDAETKGTPAARLNIHRSAPEWAGEESPWNQLMNLKDRPLWVIYDEGHGQTDVQLDQLLELGPVGIISASATPVASPRITQMRSLLEGSEVWKPIADRAIVSVPTTKVAAAGLLKSDIEVDDLNMTSESKVLEAVRLRAELETTANDLGVELRPRALYVTEESNSQREEPRPVAIWRILIERGGVPSKAIAVATSTKELPKEAERITELSQLKPRHRHIIFNKKFQEGWDDPEAYLAYFDGETKSALRINQLIGRILRQPNVKHFDAPELNKAYLFISSDDEKFAGIVSSVRKHLVREYGVNEFGEANVKVTRRSERLAPIGLREGLPELSLPVWSIVARNLEPLVAEIERYGRRPFAKGDLEAPGRATKLTFKLTEAQEKIVSRVVEIGNHIRSVNRDYFLEQVRNQSKDAFDWLPAAGTAGPMFKQDAAMLSPAQADLGKQAREFVDGFEARVRFAREADPEQDTWKPGPYTPTRSGLLGFSHSVHSGYPDAPSFLNNDEKAFATALDATGAGWWMRNPSARSQGGYGVPLPIKVGGSQSFFPDFLWWVDGGCWAIDTTGVHILGPKVRGKLLTITEPRLALATRGKVAATLDTVENDHGWTLVLPGTAGARRSYYASPEELLTGLRAE
jgi:type III restriction enzyme